MKITFMAFLLLTTTSCNQNRPDRNLLQYINGRQLLNLNGLTLDGNPIEDLKVERISPDSITVGEPFLAKIFITDKDYRLIDAYVECTTIENPTVDTAANPANKRKRLDGCTKGLFVHNDTIFISFTPSLPGQKAFEEITLLTKDSNQVFRTQKYTFDYYVVKH